MPKCHKTLFDRKTFEFLGNVKISQPRQTLFVCLPLRRSAKPHVATADLAAVNLLGFISFTLCVICDIMLPMHGIDSLYMYELDQSLCYMCLTGYM